MIEFNIGVLGAGGRGNIARLTHQPQEGFRLIAACDRRQEVLEEYRGYFDKDFFLTQDAQALLECDQIDVIMICSPDFFHEQHAIEALNAGKAVYLEKPMATTIEGCDRILEAARTSGSPLYLGHNMRHFPVIRKMKTMIDEGMIGEVRSVWCRHFVGFGGDFYFKDWHADRRNSNSLLLQKGAHDIDIIHWLSGSYTTRVTAMGNLTIYNQIEDRDPNPAFGKRDWSERHWPPLSLKGMNPIIDVEDLSMMLMELNNGILCSYQQCHYTPDYWRNYTVIGTEGRIENFGDSDENCVIKLYNRKSGYRPDADLEVNVKPAVGGHGGADMTIIREFLDFLKGGKDITTSPVAARYAVAAGCKATESLRSGSVPMEVPPLSSSLNRHFSEELSHTFSANGAQ